ncbi:MAG: hypothetical protein WC076_02580 [Terrimicrobiaceae bacterium]|nr:hypothetical protein [Terrimicrobiaceae bacterium]
MNDNPEIRARVLEWQRRHNIQDNDPALALIDLLDIYYRQPVVVQAPAADGRPAQPHISPEALSEAVRSTLQPSIDRLVAQVQEIPRGGGQGASANPEALANSIRQSVQPELEKVLAKLQEPPVATAPPISAEVLSDAIRISLLPSLDRITLQFQELQKKLEITDVEETLKKIEAYHENIDYCTKKLDVVKKESEALIVKLEKASAEIKPITRGAVLMLILMAGIIGFVLANILR